MDKLKEVVDEKRDQLKGSIPALGPAERLEVESKLEYLDALLDEEARDNRLKEPRVFISYAEQSGDQLLKKVWGKIRQLEENFQVESGMRTHGDPEVMTHIVRIMRQCCIFVGIFTAEYQLHSRRKSSASRVDNSWPGQRSIGTSETTGEKHAVTNRTVTKQDLSKAGHDVRPGIPSSWVILEAGMAQSLGLPVVLLVENGIHPDFWFKAMGHWRQAHFRRDNPEPGLAFLATLIQEHYRRLRMK